MKKPPLLLIALCSLLCVVSSAQADTTWANFSSDFNSGDSWLGGVAPTNAGVFNGTVAAQPNLTANYRMYQLLFLSGASGYNLTADPGFALTLLGDGIAGGSQVIRANGSVGTQIISAPLIFGAASGGLPTIVTAVNESVAITGVISATATNVGLNKYSEGTLFLMGANTYAGTTSFDTSGGVIVANTIGNVGSGPTSLGAPTTALAGTIQINNAPIDTLRYVGGAASTDRNISYNASSSFTSSFILDASGSGALTWNGNMISNGSQVYAKNFWLSGLNKQNNTFAGSIQDATSGTGANFKTLLMKNGSGNWILTGSNTFTGGLAINGGTLTVDYQHGASLASGNFLTFGNNSNSGAVNSSGIASVQSQGGTLKLIGNSTGTTSQTFGNLRLYYQGGTYAPPGQSKIIVDPNGGAGFNLTVGDTWTRSTGLLYIDLPTGATLTSNPGMNNSIIGQQNNQGWALVNDSTGLGYGTVVGGQVVRYTGATQLVASSYGFGVNYKLSGGLTMTNADHVFNTLSVDTAGGGTLAMSATASNYSASILFTGTSDYAVTGSPIQVNNIHQYSQGTVSIDGLTGIQGGAINVGGPGTLALVSRGTGTLIIQGAALRANGASVITGGNTVINSGGVLELGAVGDLTATLGSGTGSIWIDGDGGFSAYDSTNMGVGRAVRLNNNTNTIAWGSQYFVPNESALVLSNVKSNATVDFQNGLDLGLRQHLVTVNDGSAKVDAKLSGVLSSSYGGGLIKDGNGTLSLTGNNTYIGETWVNAGTLLVNGDQSAATGAVKVAVGATLGGTGIIGGATTISGNHSPGNSPGIQTFASDLTYTSGASVTWELSSNTTVNAANPNAIFDTIVVDGNLDFAGPTNLNLSFTPTGSDVLWADSLWSSNKTGTDGWLLYDLNGGTLNNFGNLSLVTINWLDSAGNALLTDHPLAGFSLYQDGNDIYLNYAAIPEPGVWALMAFGLTILIVFRQRKAVVS
ncbi:hypothetical protein BH09VER1_BH09VER1_36290 [soil metagenome]